MHETHGSFLSFGALVVNLPDSVGSENSQINYHCIWLFLDPMESAKLTTSAFGKTPLRVVGNSMVVKTLTPKKELLPCRVIL